MVKRTGVVLRSDQALLLAQWEEARARGYPGRINQHKTQDRACQHWRW